MYNIAICISAEPRYWSRAADSISRLKRLHPDCRIDVFYHFWDNITKRQSHLINDFEIEKIDKFYSISCGDIIINTESKVAHLVAPLGFQVIRCNVQ